MREIKYRLPIVCHCGHKSFQYFEFNGQEFIPDGYTQCPCGNEHYEIDGDIEQYTGKKDKNKKEIYEGDIVECESNSNGIYTCLVEWNSQNGKFALTKYKGYPEINHRAGNQYGCHPFGFDGSNIFDASRQKIIGNKYENSKLLEA